MKKSEAMLNIRNTGLELSKGSTVSTVRMVSSSHDMIDNIICLLRLP